MDKERFEKIVQSIFKKKTYIDKSFIIVHGYIPKNVEDLIENFKALLPSCKIIHFSKKDFYDDIEKIIINADSTILIVKYNKKKKSPEITLSQSYTNSLVKLNILRLTQMSFKSFFGNFNKWSRPFFIFEKVFDERPDLKIFKFLLVSLFNSKMNHLKIAPFFDHIIALFYVNSKILLRVFQIINKKKKDFNLTEIGPRIMLSISNFKLDH